MSDLASSPPQPITTELTCIECGYALRGLDHANACPECATPISKSIHGSELSHGNPLLVARLPLSMTAGIIGDAAAIASTLVVWLPYAASVQWAYGDSISSALHYSVVPFAYWSSAYLLALPRSPLNDHEPSIFMLSRWLRVVATLSLALMPFQWGLFPPQWSPFRLLMIAINLASTALYFTLLLRFARLASDQFLKRHIPLALALAILNHLTAEIIPSLKSISQRASNATAMDSAIQVAIYLASIVYSMVVSLQAYQVFTRAAVASRENWVSAKS